MLTPILRLTVFVLSDASQVPDVGTANAFLNTPLDDVFGETIEEVGATLRPLCVESRDLVAPRVVAVGDFFREVVPVLLQAISGIQLGVFGAVRDGGEVTDTEVDARRLGTGCGWCLDFVLADEMESAPFF